MTILFATITILLALFVIVWGRKEEAWRRRDRTRVTFPPRWCLRLGLVWVARSTDAYRALSVARALTRVHTYETSSNQACPTVPAARK